MKKKSMCLTFCKILLLFFFTFHFFGSKAQNQLPDSVVTVRLNYLKNSLELDKNKTLFWWYGWLGGYSAATIGQGIVYLNSSDKSIRQDMALGAATTLLGVAGQFVGQIQIGNESNKLSMLPEGNISERMQKLAVAEQLLGECAKREQMARSWKNHALTGAVNLGGGLINWLGFKRDIGAGIGYFALNTLITEAQIWSQPTLAKRNFRKYRQKYMIDEKAFTSVPSVQYSVFAFAGGLGLKVVF